MKYPVVDYNFIKFEKSNTNNKKYDAIIQNKITKQKYIVPFGDTRYEQYIDSTGLNLYKNLNHYDKARRTNYKIRHRKTFNKNYYSPAYFSWIYLWNA